MDRVGEADVGALGQLAETRVVGTLDRMNPTIEELTAAAGVKRQISETAADAKEKMTEIGGNAAGQLSEAAQSATNKVKAAADYLRQTELKAMTEDVKDIVKRYPGWTLAAAAVVGFLFAHLRSRD